MGGDARAMEGLKEKSRQPIGEFSPNTGYMSAGMWDKWNNNFIHRNGLVYMIFSRLNSVTLYRPLKGCQKG